jgi:D-alanyl-D-alanine carboxypeptidase (penicillin-binding protein 5/6)
MIQRDGMTALSRTWRNPAPIAAALVFVSALLLSTPAWPAAGIETSAREVILVDNDTGAVLLDSGSDLPMPPASMSKIMTVYMVFEALREERISLDTTFPVSEKAWRMGGSKMFVEIGSEVRVEDLLRGVIVQSGNDACIVLAEGLAGSEEAFAELMTKRAGEIGMRESTFANSTGWPDPNQRMSARDLAHLASQIIRGFPEYYGYFAEKEFVWSEIRQGNRNPLLYKNIGADGLKTGHTEEAGYGLTASAVQDDRRLILVVTGLESVKERSSEATKLLTWGFRQFDNYALFKEGEEVDEAPVWLGELPSVPLVAKEDVVVTLGRDARRDMKVTLTYDGPIPSPVIAGDQIAQLTITAPGMDKPRVVPLLAGADVPRLGPIGRIMGSIKHLIFGTSLAVN